MRVFFSLLIAYILLCVFGTALLASLITVYMGCLAYVVGQPINLISIDVFIESAKISFPIVILFSQMFLILSVIRNLKKQRILSVITIVSLALISWGGVLPLYYKYINYDVNLLSIQSKKSSAGYFRYCEDGLYYFTKVYDDKKVDGIVIDIKSNYQNQNIFEVYNNKVVTIKEADIYSDVLVKRVVDFPGFFKGCVFDLYHLCNIARKSFSNSILAWIMFSSLGAVLTSLIFLRTFSRWRLVNAFIVLFATIGIIKLNVILFGVGIQGKILEYINLINHELNQLWGGFAGYGSPLCFIVNLLFNIIVVLTGILCNSRNKTIIEG